MLKHTNLVLIAVVDVVLLVVLLSVAALIVSVVTIFICKTKAWVMKDPKTQPKCLVRHQIGKN